MTDLIEQFRGFLMMESALGKFASNLNMFKENPIKVDEYLKRNIEWPQSFVTNAFFWERTLQGHYYWAKISRKWQKLLEVQNGHK